MTYRVLIALVAGAAMTSAAVQAQTPSAPAAEANQVDPLTVVGARAPTADAPRSATCEYWVRTDPILRSYVNIMSATGLGSPRFRLPTRLPRDPDLKSPPRSLPGSAFPEIGPKRWVAAEPGTFAPVPIGMAMAEPDEFTLEGGQAIQSDNPVLGKDELAAAVNVCRAGYTSEVAGIGSRELTDRALIARNDKTLPLGFALYDDGRFEEAMGQFKKAFVKLPDRDGGDEAGLMVGKIYLLALREKNDPVQAVVWLKKVGGGRFDPENMIPVFDPKAPDRNTAMGEAAMLLGRIYMTGVGPVARDPVEARKWFKRAFEVGHIAAAKIVGDMEYAGTAGPRDMEDAFAWYRRGARFGHAPAQFALARMYESGEAGKTDLKLAAAWYNEAAKIGHPAALYALAYAYDTGAGVPADPTRAMGLYKAAALKGDHGAQAALASSFYAGDQLQKDLPAARRWFEAAARGGDTEAMFSLAAMMIRGEGGEVDLVKAWSWLYVARIQKHPKATTALAALETRMSAEQRKAAVTLVGAT